MPPASLADGERFTFYATATNTTTTPTLQINSLSPTIIVDNFGNPLVAGAIQTGQLVEVAYKASITKFQLIQTTLTASIIAGIGALLKTNNLSDLVSASTARTNLGLGTPTTSGPIATTTGSFVVGNLIVAADTAGTIQDSGIQFFPSGTRIVFRQGTAPTGWTQDVTVNDQVLRFVNTSSVSTGGSWVLTGVTLGSHALTQGELPNVNFTVTDPGHVHTVNDPGHAHSYNDTANGGAPFIKNAGTPFNFGQTSSTSSDVTGVTINATTTGITVASGGSGTAHTHTWSNDGTWRPAYADVIVATKN